jgi:glycosyltransferase involved in cell wall biosynthesis
MKLAVVTSFLDEERYLPTFLRSVESQDRPPDELVLVNDGSIDRSGLIAVEFAARHEYARVVTRPHRPRERDRLARAAELVAFCWGAEQIDIRWDVVAKLDADLDLTPDFFAEIMHRFEEDPRLGVGGGYFSVQLNGTLVRERCPPGHVRGGGKFYRRACFNELFPLPVHLGWDTADEVVARMHGWHTQTFAIPSRDPIHMRPTATQDGFLRGRRRDGVAAWGYGAGLRWVLIGTVRRSTARPIVISGLNYLLGWLLAGIRRDPRPGSIQRAFMRAEHRARTRTELRRLLSRLKPRR